jgi:hypothetical protein
MAIPNSSKRIAPFPTSTISREYFGPYLSGFSDGEGCFLLRFKQDHEGRRVTCNASFDIKLRSDDCGVLSLIQSFWQCGYLYKYREDKRAGQEINGNPFSHFCVAKIHDLATVVVPHFERFPLLAKKSRDFAIWKEAVGVMSRVKSRPRRTRFFKGGSYPRWHSDDINQFANLVKMLKMQRVYNQPCVEIPKAPIQTFFGDNF